MNSQDLLDKLIFMFKESVEKAQKYHYSLDELRLNVRSIISYKNPEALILSEEQSYEIQMLENLYQEEEQRQKEILDVMNHLKHYGRE